MAKRSRLAYFFHGVWYLTLSLVIVVGLPLLIAWLLGIL